jgi:hypothetical protein
MIIGIVIWLAIGWCVRGLFKDFTSATEQWYLNGIILLWPITVIAFIYVWLNRKEYR